MTEEIIQQDANTPESSEPAQTSPETQESAPEQAEAPQPRQVPFHEDPAIRDYIERQIAKQTETYAKQLEEMQSRLRESSAPKEPKQAHPFVQKLTEIDPKYGEWAGNMEQLQDKLAQFEAWQKDQQRQQVITQYESAVSRLHTENNVPKELQDLYKDALDAAAIKDPKLGLKDLPNVYKSIHEKFSKLLETTKREERKSYVADKKADATAPASQPKGKVASPNKAPDKFKNREDMYASMIKSAMAKSGAESDL